MDPVPAPVSPAPPTPGPWPMRLAALAWVGVGVAGWFLADGLGLPGQVVLAGLWVVGLGLLFRHFVASLFGPVLAYDGLRAGRRKWNIYARVAYAVFLFIVFTFTYFSWYQFATRYGAGVRTKDMAKLAESFFSAYMVIQFILVCLLTPAAVAGAIADEKERRTLEFLLATDLRDREILFGKLASRLGVLLLFLLSGIPILSAIQFFGGIDPNMVLAGMTATFTTTLTLAALSIAASVMARRARDAILLTYLAAIGYVFLSLFVHVMAQAPGVRDERLEVFGYSIAPDDVTYPFVAGNPFWMVPAVLVNRMRGGINLLDGLWHYLLFDVVVIAFLVGWAGFRLRAIALAQAFGGPKQSLLRRLRGGKKGAGNPKPAPVRPAVGDAPVVWKEVFVDTGLRLGFFGKFMALGLVIFSFIPVGILFYNEVLDPSTWRRTTGAWWTVGRWGEFSEGMNAYVRAVGTIVGTLIFLAVAVRGAGAVSGERDRQSLEVLLTTPLSVSRIVWGKWWGCMLGMRWAWVWLFSIFLLALMFGGVHPIMAIPYVASTMVYASGFAWIGLYCSVACRTTMRATMSAIALSVFVGGGYWLVVLFCCLMPASFAMVGSSTTPDPDATEIAFEVGRNFLCSFTPSVNMAWLPVFELSEQHLTLAYYREKVPYIPFWLLGVGAWALLSYGLSRRTIARFERMANRVPMIPEVPPKRRGPPPLPREGARVAWPEEELRLERREPGA